MKKNKLKSSLFVGLFALAFSLPLKVEGKLTDITKPWLGQYECESATYQGEEYLDDFSFIRIELKPKGKFKVFYKKKDGSKAQSGGYYEYDEEKEEITLYGEGKETLKRKFPLKNGVMQITVRLGLHTLSMKFKQK